MPAMIMWLLFLIALVGDSSAAESEGSSDYIDWHKDNFNIDRYVRRIDRVYDDELGGGLLRDHWRFLKDDVISEPEVKPLEDCLNRISKTIVAAEIELRAGLIIMRMNKDLKADVVEYESRQPAMVSARVILDDDPQPYANMFKAEHIGVKIHISTGYLLAAYKLSLQSLSRLAHRSNGYPLTGGSIDKELFMSRVRARALDVQKGIDNGSLSDNDVARAAGIVEVEISLLSILYSSADQEYSRSLAFALSHEFGHVLIDGQKVDLNSFRIPVEGLSTGGDKTLALSFLRETRADIYGVYIDAQLADGFREETARDHNIRALINSTFLVKDFGNYSSISAPGFNTMIKAVYETIGFSERGVGTHLPFEERRKILDTFYENIEDSEQPKANK